MHFSTSAFSLESAQRSSSGMSSYATASLSGSKPFRLPRMYLAVFLIFRYFSLSCLKMASEQRISTL